MDAEEAQTLLHHYFLPLFKQWISGIHTNFVPLIQAKKTQGWKGEKTRKLERALRRWVDRCTNPSPEVVSRSAAPDLEGLKQELSLFPEFRPMFEQLADLVLTVADLERKHFWVWLYTLLDEMKREGLIK